MYRFRDKLARHYLMCIACPNIHLLGFFADCDTTTLSEHDISRDTLTRAMSISIEDNLIIHNSDVPWVALLTLGFQDN